MYAPLIVLAQKIAAHAKRVQYQRSGFQLGEWRKGGGGYTRDIVFA